MIIYDFRVFVVSEMERTAIMNDFEVIYYLRDRVLFRSNTLFSKAYTMSS